MFYIKQLSLDNITSNEISQLIGVLNQLSNSVDENLVLSALQSNQSQLLVAIAEEEEVIVGTATMGYLFCVTGIRVHIEDVVVDSEYRGKGIGRLLIEEAISRANSINAKTIDLTSRPDRVAANRLYCKMGFVQRDTNVYRYVTPIRTHLNKPI
ncbi:acyl-CoA N-acyltransferase [Pilobolus umbonatus]|nr:acyl-CoA N-acyltransferase [Pilobolus umbonatus]